MKIASTALHPSESIGVDDLHEMCRDLDGEAVDPMDYATIERELDAILLPSVVVGIVAEVAGSLPVDYRTGFSFTNCSEIPNSSQDRKG